MTRKKHISESRTEDTVIDLLKIQGWSTERPPKGVVVRKNEYKNYPVLSEIFKGRSKTGNGDGYPDFIIVDAQSMKPLVVIEAKAHEDQLDQASNEAKEYADACVGAGTPVIAIGVSGQDNTTIRISVYKRIDGKWLTIKYNNEPISWIPTPCDAINLIQINDLLELSPVVPSNEVLAEKADRINRILREAAIKDEYRPAHVGAMMLALWHSKGRIRRDVEYILGDINSSCQKAFSSAEKATLGESLSINEANTKLAHTAWEILSILEKLNVVNASFDHDYLGQLYETFFRYTGGNTIGQYFTPRHITRMMADLCEVTKDDKVIDPTCGTGGFFVAVIQRACEMENAKYEDVVEMVRKNLIGYESEPLTAALCVANMILRGDGKSGITREDVFHATKFPNATCNVALMNPPFPHASTDKRPEDFIDKALEALLKRGKLAVIIPTSLIVKKEFRTWRDSILKNHTLSAVIELPDEVFQPYASTTTSILLIEKGIPHSGKFGTSFVHLKYDGLNLKKGVRVARRDGKNQIPDAITSVIDKLNTPGFSCSEKITSGMEWAPGAYIPSGIPDDEELMASIDELLRRYASFFTRYASEIATQRSLIKSGDLIAREYRNIITEARIKNAGELSREIHTIGHYFDIVYGQKELHSRDGIPPGDSLIISPTEKYNGTYGWLEFDNLIKPPFITVAQTGSIGEAFVQTEPCGVNDDCLILLPKAGMDIPEAVLFIAAATIRLERWRFSYGRKLTPSRISSFRFERSPALEEWVAEQLKAWKYVGEQAISIYTNND